MVLGNSGDVWSKPIEPNLRKQLVLELGELQLLAGMRSMCSTWSSKIVI